MFCIVQMRGELCQGDISAYVNVAFRLAAKDQRYANLFVPVIKEHMATAGTNVITKVSFVILQKLLIGDWTKLPDVELKMFSDDLQPSYVTHYPIFPEHFQIINIVSLPLNGSA